MNISEKNQTRFWSKVDTAFNDEDCWTWTGGMMTNGYGRFKLGRKYVGAHRFSHFLTKGNPEDKMVLHSCGCRNCVNPLHLRLGTAQDNADDKTRDGMTPRGEKHSFAKLSNESVLNIRRRYNDGELVSELASELNVSAPTIYDALRERTWKHLSQSP